MKRQPLWQYKQISAELIRKIESGELVVNSKLPSEKLLCEQYDVSRITVRKALAELEEKHYIIRRQGQGSFVKAHFEDAGISYIDNNSEDLRRLGHSVYIELHEFSILADGEEPKVRRIMQMNNSEYLYRVNQVYISDRRPIIQRETFMSFADFPLLTSAELQNTELMPLLARKFDLNLKRLHHEISTEVEDIPSRLYGIPNTSPRESYIKAKTTYTNEENRTVYLSNATTAASSKVFFVRHKEENVMSEPHILLTRIDNRLVHGQVGVTWTKTLGANLILVANDQAAQDILQQKLMKSTAESSGAQIRFFTLQKTIDVIQKAADRQKIFIVVKTPEDALTLIKGNVPIKELNVGNMHFAPGKEEITKKVYVDQSDKDALMGAVNMGVNVYIQDVPDDHKTEVNF
ncbi:PTS galactosamine transporter subunit IIB [Pediococcus pentosaceus]|uniref:PTS galactosamine transporter subunit IIB n=1 Tax=Pediococcus pentosaceus TaxID=1255 RepID=UPI000CFF8C29|nr:PTS galactosamine transporter subunit IIB [Pediococcus pentosaceus]AVL02411.1 GntR family transcriptional regulator [Pediococcus pentosaceus]MBF7135190.1 PTS N-acetylgalactosamine transporter subunit IIB [Pediococcus pentosaceus]QPT36540.1 PTS N-acetylgalactosamine transporter subunit IIB [Pediococcus pentosaceus]